jgi:RNA polymerase sigma-70 factor (ECF subfamily)
MNHDESTDNQPARAGDVFQDYRPLLFSIAYRMLGSVMDAEDIVQDAFLRWRQRDPATVAAPKSYLTTTVTHLCIDHLRLARIRREEYVGSWLPEPLVVDERAVDADPVVLAESLALGFLALLEQLSPVERAVFLLHEVFGYPFDEIAGMVGKSGANCRQIARRAREHLHAPGPRFVAEPEQQERLAHQFMETCASGDVPALVAMLAADVTLYADGGGNATAVRRPIHGADAVARFLIGIRKFAPPGLVMRVTPVNGQPALVCAVDGRPVSVFALELAGRRIRTVRVIVNPEKFHGLTPSHRPDE